MPCFKAEHTLDWAVKAILAQDFQQWELLLLVDGSPDNTLRLADQWAQSDARIRLINSRHNRGVIRMRNLGIRLAKGNWIAFCDADDWWEMLKLSSQLHLAESQQANLVCSAFYYVRGTEGKRLREVQLPAPITYPRMLTTNAVAMSTAMFNRQALGRQYFQSMPDGLIHEDYAFWLQMFRTKPVKAAYLSMPVANIRVQPGSRSANKWLAMRSHAYVLREIAGLPYWKLSWHLLSYARHALGKRLPRISAKLKAI
ncbi:MAG: glycosyltransferase family 2 protein [Bacteroidia bacterium]